MNNLSPKSRHGNKHICTSRDMIWECMSLKCLKYTSLTALSVKTQIKNRKKVIDAKLEHRYSYELTRKA